MAELLNLRAIMDESLTFQDLEMSVRKGQVTLNAVLGPKGGSPHMKILAAVVLGVILGDGDEPAEPSNYRGFEFTLTPAGCNQELRVYVECIKPGGQSSVEIRKDLEAQLAELRPA